MRRTRWFHYAMLSILGAGTIALFLALVAPASPSLDNFQISDSDDTIVVNGFLDGLAATPPAPLTITGAPTLVASALPSLCEVLGAVPVVREAAPRAPPVFSFTNPPRAVISA
ncbi:MAG: hypothetical protein HYZ91_05435 [Candidatus Omnitrophica bacterium]|nr:hypothetical protein [Candidatus Omnitrophota bacterium]